MAVITISREYGSKGDEIAQKVADKIGYQIFSKMLIAQVAAEYGLSQDVIDYSEEHHRARGFFERLFERSMTLYYPNVWLENPEVDPQNKMLMEEETAVSFVEKAVIEAYRRSNFVIVGRGGQAILAGKPGVLHVRVVSPMEERIQWVKEQIRENRELDNTNLDLRREAQELIEEKDLASKDYIKCFYKLDWSDPSLYHLVINTAKINQDQAVRTIVSMAKEIKD